MKKIAARKNVKDEIIRVNRHLFQKAFPNNMLTDWKTPGGRLIVNLMRSRLGYSNNTANYDIHYQAFRTYIDLKKNGQIET